MLEPIRCPRCAGDAVVKYGKNATGKQRYQCQNPTCGGRAFILEFSYRGRRAEVKQQIIEMALSGSGVRETARVLQISPTTVIEELKKRGTAPIG